MGYRAVRVFVAVLVLFPAAATAQSQFDIVHAFNKGGVYPDAPLVYAADGNFYGTTTQGGTSDWGTIFRTSPDGATATLHSFGGGPAGAVPKGALIQATDGNLYGTTFGYSDSFGWAGCGTVFRITPAGALTTLHAFSGQDGCWAFGAVVQARDGDFYGTTVRGGAYNHGTIFRVGSDGTFTLLYSFGGGADGGAPNGGLVQAADGHLYGTSTQDGAFGQGTIFRVTSAGALTLLHAFQGVNQSNPSALTLASDGRLYGTTYGLWPYDSSAWPGIIFRIAPGEGFTVVHTFQGPEGWNARGPLVQASDGNFYGVATLNGFGGPPRLLFRMTPQGIVTKAGSFGDDALQSGPTGGLVEAPDGLLYGVKRYDGSFNYGSVFRIARDGTANAILHEFTWGPGGTDPHTPLVLAADGNLYGTTDNGGAAGIATGGGTLFRLTPAGILTFLRSFESTGPFTGLMQAKDGRLYGSGQSSIFTTTLDGADLRVYDFLFGSPPFYPSMPIETADGNFYGTSRYTIGANGSCGSVFRMSRGGVFTALTGITASNNCEPSGLILARDGNFYGTTTGGGVYDLGTIFRMTPSGVVTVLRSFAGGTGDGRRPRAALTEASDGFFYGTTSEGGAFGKGTVFRISQDGAFALLHSFDGMDGSHPRTTLVEGPDRNFYGTTSGLLGINQGTAFAMTPAGAVTLLHTFHGDDGALFGFAGLTWAGGGDFYGVAEYGPTHEGEIFRLRVRGTLSGRIRAAASGAPIANARLAIEPGGLIATTDASGVYSVVLPIGIYTVTVMADGYQPSRAVNIVVGPNALRTSDMSLSPPTLRAGDYDADGRIDMATWQPSSGTWRIRQSSNSQTLTPAWGNGMWPYEDVPVPADYDGDGKTDLAIWRPSTGTWWIVQSGAGRGVSVTWGNGMPPYNDVPVPADYDGDRKSDIAVWRPSTGTWWIVQSGDGRGVSVTWGNGLPPYDDVPVPADYDGDGATDIAVWRPSTGTWWIVRSSDGHSVSVTWGVGLAPYDDVPVPADYDGDGTTDIAVWRPSTGTWWIVRSSDGRGVAVTWGNGLAPYSDQPMPADYDGDGTADIAIWRPSTATWWIVRSSDGGVVTVTQGL